MNIIEAAKTGLPMRRKEWVEGDPWITWPDPKLVTDVGLSQDDLISTDWEVKEPKVEISLRDLERAFEVVGDHHKPLGAFRVVAKELGLPVPGGGG